MSHRPGEGARPSAVQRGTPGVDTPKDELIRIARAELPWSAERCAKSTPHYLLEAILTARARDGAGGPASESKRGGAGGGRNPARADPRSDAGAATDLHQERNAAPSAPHPETSPPISRVHASREAASANAGGAQARASPRDVFAQKGTGAAPKNRAPTTPTVLGGGAPAKRTEVAGTGRTQGPAGHARDAIGLVAVQRRGAGIRAEAEPHAYREHKGERLGQAGRAYDETPARVSGNTQGVEERPPDHRAHEEMCGNGDEGARSDNLEEEDGDADSAAYAEPHALQLPHASASETSIATAPRAETKADRGTKVGAHKGAGTGPRKGGGGGNASASGVVGDGHGAAGDDAHESAQARTDRLWRETESALRALEKTPQKLPLHVQQVLAWGQHLRTIWNAVLDTRFHEFHVTAVLALGEEWDRRHALFCHDWAPDVRALAQRIYCNVYRDVLLPWLATERLRLESAMECVRCFQTAGALPRDSELIMQFHRVGEKIAVLRARQFLA
jgi:hypothetical protein